MEELSIFEEGNVKVTNARFVVDGQTYAMNSVTSVRQFEKKPQRIWPISVFLVGLVIAFGGGSGIFGSIVMAVGVALWVIQRTEFSVLLSTASGEARALASKDGAYILRVVSALNTAIVQRG